jgi:hypothetical protein
MSKYDPPADGTRPFQIGAVTNLYPFLGNCCCCCFVGGSGGGGGNGGGNGAGEDLSVLLGQGIIPEAGLPFQRGPHGINTYLAWRATGGKGQTTADIDLIRGPGAPAKITEGALGFQGHAPFTLTESGHYVFRVNVRDSGGNTHAATYELKMDV